VSQFGARQQYICSSVSKNIHIIIVNSYLPLYSRVVIIDVTIVIAVNKKGCSETSSFELVEHSRSIF
jgi:hypothetical protein